MIKYAIFDVDGTLLDSMQMWINFGSDYLRSKGVDFPPDIDETIQYFSLRETAEYLSANFGIGTADEIEEDARRVTREFYFEKVLPKEGVHAFLKMLRENGVRMYVATATYSSLIRPALERLGLLEFFEGIVTCSDVGHGKDKPHIFMAALNAIDGEIESAWVFEDAMHAAKTAKAAGFSVCGVYDLTEKDNKEALRELCDIYTESFSALNMENFN
ncbi:MAG: HAD family phosphatase [Clostridia bacterium]|nr:HAD family phosphatase [Clostridia bacterium]